MVRKRTLGSFPFFKNGMERVLPMLTAGTCTKLILFIGLSQNQRQSSQLESRLIYSCHLFSLQARFLREAKVYCPHLFSQDTKAGLIQGPGYLIGSAYCKNNIFLQFSSHCSRLKTIGKKWPHSCSLRVTRFVSRTEVLLSQTKTIRRSHTETPSISPLPSALQPATFCAWHLTLQCSPHMLAHISYYF